MNYLWDMKKNIWCLILTLCHIHFSFGQIFHFDEDSTVLIKDVKSNSFVKGVPAKNAKKRLA